MTIRIATRGSKLALWQAEHVKARLLGADAALTVELVVIKTTGDKIQDRPLSEVGGKGLFVKEIEEALLDGSADVAVHSLKDLPADLPAGLRITIPEREDPRDALLVRPGLDARTVAELPGGARVGTSSLRRMCQLKAARPDLEVLALRGNVDTRLRKLDEGQLDAIVLAAAGLNRLGFAARITALLAPSLMLPAIGQGALAIECRERDGSVRARLAPLEDPATTIAVTAERAFLGQLGGTCKTPLGAHATVEGQRLQLEGLIGRPDGSQILRGRLEGTAAEAADLGVKLAEQLLAAGGREILVAL